MESSFPQENSGSKRNLQPTITSSSNLPFFSPSLLSPWSLAARSPARRGSLRLGGGECRRPALRLRRPRWPLGEGSMSSGTHFCLDPVKNNVILWHQRHYTGTPWCNNHTTLVKFLPSSCQKVWGTCTVPQWTFVYQFNFILSPEQTILNYLGPHLM